LPAATLTLYDFAMRLKLLAFVALAALAACAKPAAVNAPANAATNAAANAAVAPVTAPSPKLATIFAPDILGANVAFLETLTGPAFRTDGAERTYKVDGCEIIVGTSKGKVDNIGIVGVTPACSFPIAQYFAGGYDHPVPPLPTFGDIQQGLGGSYSADCLRLCGNAAAPVVTLTYQGSHADNFNNLVAEIPITDDPALAAYTQWGDALTAKYGEDYVTDGKYKNGDALDDVAAKAFAPIRPTTIRVGSNLPGGS
jgi:hypothetical protein